MAFSELLEQAKMLVMANKRPKDEHIMLEQQVKGKATILIHSWCYHNLLSFFFLLDLKGNISILTDKMAKAEQEALKGIEENTKLKDKIRGSKIFCV